MIGERTVDGLTVRTLRDERGGVEAGFVPAAGMVGCSLRYRGHELLGQRGGLHAYMASGSTMGIPLLHPWANRLAGLRFQVAGREVALDAGFSRLALDGNGLPIHGLLAAASGWVVERHEPTEDGGVLAARFDFAHNEELMAAFPFPHELLLEATLGGSTLTVTTTVKASGDVGVPISFGYHPYLRLPGVERAEWEVEIPVSERLELDDRMLPTGSREPVDVEGGFLGSRVFDDGFLAPPDSAPFVLAGGGTRIELSLGGGYPYAQVYAPDDDDVIAYEPMTAPANALITGGSELPMLEPGDDYRATFSIAVADAL